MMKEFFDTIEDEAGDNISEISDLEDVVPVEELDDLQQRLFYLMT